MTFNFYITDSKGEQREVAIKAVSLRDAWHIVVTQNDAGDIHEISLVSGA